MNALPIAVVGAGPVGLAAAAHLMLRGLPVKLYEAGGSAAANILDWTHVRLFSPWRFNVDEAARSILCERGWQEPDADTLPTGRELYDAYLAPLAEVLTEEEILETRARVRSISRHGMDKVMSEDRATHPFALAIDAADGARVDLARAVIDASGTWQNPNPLGASGTAAVGEPEAARHIHYGIPDVLRAERPQYAGKRILVVGGRHSAVNVLLDLVRLAEIDNGTSLTWALRRGNPTRAFGAGVVDPLPARAQLGRDIKQLIETGAIRVVAGFAVDRVDGHDGEIRVSGTRDGAPFSLGPFDRIVVATGQRPDPTLTRELRLDLDSWLECPRRLGPGIDPHHHSWGRVPPHGYRELAHPEPAYFAVGSKSYGRAPTFLMAIGYEQVRSVVAHLGEDQSAADELRPVLPASGIIRPTNGTDPDLASRDDGAARDTGNGAAQDTCCTQNVTAQAREEIICCSTP
jgi:thioredoxin reductase